MSILNLFLHSHFNFVVWIFGVYFSKISQVFFFFDKGNWIDDERNGQGTLEYGTGEVYEGKFKDDKLREYMSEFYSDFRGKLLIRQIRP